jgi:type I restriction enzyme S subunit
MYPDSWRDATLSDLISLQRGHDLPSQNRVEGEVPIMSAAGFVGFHIKANVRGPGIVIGRSGSGFGKVHFSPVDYWAHNTALFVKDFKGNYEPYVFYLLKNIDFSSYNSGGVQPSLNRNFIYPIKVGISPFPEQKKIAQILSTWDLAIIATESLLENSQQRKKGLMQHLLTGKRRLPGFEGKWKEIKLEFMIQEVKKEKVDQPSAIELLTVKLHYKGIVPSGKFPTPTTKGRPYYRRAAGELIIGRQNIHNGGIGIVPDKCNGLIASNAISSYEAANSANINFILYFMSTDRFRFIVDNLSGGTGQKELSSRELLKIAVKMPSENEQKAIAAVLATSDAEIQSIQHLLSCLKEEKKALMQQLLTGKRRVTVEVA